MVAAQSLTEHMDRPRRVPLKKVVEDCMERWFRSTAKAAGDGDVASQSMLGQMLMSGYGTGQDTVQAIHWLRMAAAANDTDAQKMLASLVPGGNGVQDALAIESLAVDDKADSTTTTSSPSPSPAPSLQPGATAVPPVGSCLPVPGRCQGNGQMTPNRT